MTLVIFLTVMNVKATNFTALLNKLNAKRVHGFSVKVDEF